MEKVQLENDQFEGANTVYIFDGDGPLTLVDTGLGTDEGDRQLREKLGTLGYSYADIEQVFVTHWHGDHSGLAGTIQAESGATVYAHPQDADLIERNQEAVDAFHEKQYSMFTDWEMPDRVFEELRQFIEGEEAFFGETPEVEPVEADDILRAGEYEMTVKETPGHSLGHVIFEFDDEERKAALVGDTLLPHYTPNVGGADIRVEDPLDTYLDTLEWLDGREFDYVLPGHRDRIDDPSGRSATIRDHHHGRTERVLDTLATEGPTTPWTISTRLFGDLEGVHAVHGPGEVYAHLRYLEKRGEVRHEDGLYGLADA